MKTILIDAVNTLVVDGKIDEEILRLLEVYSNPKIILSNADDSEIIAFGLQNLPYKLFTLKHMPNKNDPRYFKTFLDEFKLSSKDVIYLEHNIDAVTSAKSVGINTHNFNKNTRDLSLLRDFLANNL